MKNNIFNKSIFTDGWENRLDEQMLTYNRCKKKAYVCSPLGASTKEQVLQNMREAKAYMYYVSENFGCVARAPHAYLPALLCDKIPAERALALEFGLKFLEQCEILLVCGSRISDGMLSEIIRATKLNMDILVFDDDVYTQTKKIVTMNGGDKSIVSLDRNHPILACNIRLYETDGDVT